MQFIPDLGATERKLPYFEDATMSGAAGNLTKDLAYYCSQVSQAIARLDGMVIGFTPIKSDGKPLRYGFRIAFILQGVAGRIDCAALPMRSETPGKKNKALSQALYLLWKKLDAEADAWVYNPGSIPLMPYLIGASGHTVTEELTASGILPDFKPAGYLPTPR